MKGYPLALFSILLFLTACSSTTNKNKSNKEQESHENTPTVKERDASLKANEYIIDFQNTKGQTSVNTDTLTITMNDKFSQKEISEQYLYLVDFYEKFTEKYGDLNDFFTSIDVYFNNKDIPTYTIYKRSFDIVAANVAIDREVSQRPSKNILMLLDRLDKGQVMSGTDDGLTLAEKDSGAEPKIKQTIITTSEEVKGTINSPNPTDNTEVTYTNRHSGTNDTETYIDGMNGNGWTKLTDNQKFHAVSNALYSLDQNGYTIEESEDYYIDAINAFYTDSSTMNVPVNEVLTQIAITSNTISK